MHFGASIIFEKILLGLAMEVEPFELKTLPWYNNIKFKG
jgi:hypothetical protein